MKSEGDTVPKVALFFPIHRTAPYAEPLLHCLTLAPQEKVPVFDILAIEKDMCQTLSDQKGIDHFSLFQKHICQEPPVAIIPFRIKFQSHLKTLDLPAVKPPGILGHKLAGFTLVIHLRCIDTQKADLLMTIQQHGIPIVYVCDPVARNRVSRTLFSTRDSRSKKTAGPQKTKVCHHTDKKNPYSDEAASFKI